MGKGRQKILVQRIALGIDALLFVHLLHKAAALLSRVGQFAKTVGQFHPAGIKFEPFGKPRVFGQPARQSGLSRRVAVQHRHATLPQMGFDPLDQHARQHVGPGVILGGSDALTAQRGPQRFRIGFASGGHRRQQVDLCVPLKRLDHAKTLRLLRRIAGLAAVAQEAAARRCNSKAQQRCTILHQPVVSRIGPIPFQHREFGAVQRPTLAVAPDMGKGADPRLARRQQLLHRKFGRGMQEHRMRHAVSADGAGGKAVQMRLVSRAGLQRTGIDFDEILTGKPASDRRLNAVARQQGRAPVGVAGRIPPGCRLGCSGHGGTVRFRLEIFMQMR